MTKNVAQVASKAQQAASKGTPAPTQQDSGSKPQSKPWLSAFRGASKGTDAAGPSSSSAPSLEEAADTAQSGLATAGDVVQQGYFEVRLFATHMRDALHYLRSVTGQSSLCSQVLRMLVGSIGHVAMEVRGITPAELHRKVANQGAGPELEPS